MHVYCTDGTVFDCERYDVNEFGIVLYGDEKPKDTDRYDSNDATQIGFVPHDRLWYVLPRGVAPQTGVAPSQERQPEQDATEGPRPRQSQARPAGGGQYSQTQQGRTAARGMQSPNQPVERGQQSGDASVDSGPGGRR